MSDIQKTPDHIGLPQVERPRPKAPAAETLPDDASLHDKIVHAIKTVYDPEIPVNIYEIGLIYEVTVADDDSVHVLMTLTSPMCPVAGSLPPEVQHKIHDQVAEATSVEVEVVWDPPWTVDRMSEAAKLQLGML